MPTLHLIRNPLTTAKLAEQLLARMAPTDRLLLIENGIYSIIGETVASRCLQELADRDGLFVLEPDLIARGLKSEDVLSRALRVDYAGFVELAATSARVVTW